MKRLLPLGAALLIMLALALAWHSGLIGAHARGTAAGRSDFVLQKAVWITEGPTTSNLEGSVHYISLTVSFPVMAAALTQAGGSPPGVGSTGTGSTALDSQIETAVTDLCRTTPYAMLQTPSGLRRFRRELRRAIAAYFLPGSVGPVETPSLVTQ